MLHSPFHPDNIRDFGDLRETPRSPALSRVDELKNQIHDNRDLMLKFFVGGCRYQAMQRYRSVVYLRALLSQELSN